MKKAKLIIYEDTTVQFINEIRKVGFKHDYEILIENGKANPLTVN